MLEWYRCKNLRRWASLKLLWEVLWKQLVVMKTWLLKSFALAKVCTVHQLPTFLLRSLWTTDHEAGNYTHSYLTWNSLVLSLINFLWTAFSRTYHFLWCNWVGIILCHLIVKQLLPSGCCRLNYYSIDGVEMFKIQEGICPTQHLVFNQRMTWWKRWITTEIPGSKRLGELPWVVIRVRVLGSLRVDTWVEDFIDQS